MEIDSRITGCFGQMHAPTLMKQRFMFLLHRPGSRALRTGQIDASTPDDMLDAKVRVRHYNNGIVVTVHDSSSGRNTMLELTM